MGQIAAGKSTLVKSYQTSCYKRFNRDEMGGDLAKLNRRLEEAIKEGGELFVLDNTYGTKDSRAEVVALGKKYGIPVKCVWLQTKLEDAQYNAVNRILKDHLCSSSASNFNYSDILGPNGNKFYKDIVPSIALYTYKKAFEKPTMDEGFSVIEEVVFVRKPLPPEYTRKALLLDYDGTLRKTKSGDKYPKDPNDIVILPNRKEILVQYINKGYLLLGISNQSGIEKGELTDEMAKKCFDKTNQLLDQDIHVLYCCHHSFPIRCYCRKPLPGLPVLLIKMYSLNPKECIIVGDSKTDKTCAFRSGMQFCEAEEFFK